MDYHVTQTGSKTVISLSGRLTYKDSQQFPGILDKVRQSPYEVDFNFTALEMLDSTGMGLLLQAYDITKEKGLSLKISHPKAQIQKILTNACFDIIVEL